MGERTRFEPGTFSWTDLTTTDVAGATAFYTALFGWDAEEMPAGEGLVYTMASIDGRYVGGMTAMREEQRGAGVPPNWLSYVTVDDVEATATRAGELGGTVVAPPFDVLDAGRMAVLQDPQGAAFALWQPREHIGAGVVNDPGAMILNQLNTTDPEAAADFYRDLFGWEIARVADDEPSYWGIQNAGALNGGMMALHPSAPAPPHWLVYFATEDLEDAAERIGELGGQVVVPPMSAGEGGRILVALDPQLAAFALWEGPADP